MSAGCWSFGSPRSEGWEKGFTGLLGPLGEPPGDEVADNVGLAGMLSSGTTSTESTDARAA